MSMSMYRVVHYRWTQLRKGALHFSREVQSGDLWTRQLSQAVRTGLAQ